MRHSSLDHESESPVCPPHQELKLATLEQRVVFRRLQQLWAQTTQKPPSKVPPPPPPPTPTKPTHTNTIPTAIIIGAGLGGCAAALALKAQGFDVTVYERLKTFRRLGDSLGLGENALKLLRRWGGQKLYDDLCAIGNQAEDMQIREWSSGRVLARQPLMDMGKLVERYEIRSGRLANVFLDVW